MNTPHRESCQPLEAWTACEHIIQLLFWIWREFSKMAEHNDHGITFFQALYRGYCVRKKMREVRSEYDEICRGIDNELYVSWSERKQNCLQRPYLSYEPLTADTLSVGSERSAQENDRDKLDISDGSIMNDEAPNGNKLAYSTRDINPHAINSNIDDSVSQDLNGIGNYKSRVDNETESQSHYAMSSEVPMSSRMSGYRQDVSFNGGDNGNKIESVKNTTNYPSGGLSDNLIAQQRTQDRAFLEKQKAELTMELLWIKQAIESRKNYLRLREGMSKEPLQLNLTQDTSIWE